jgi:hypothetical protein
MSAEKGYANVAELLANIFDPYVDLIPGTKKRRKRLVALTKRITNEHDTLRARRLLLTCWRITHEQIAAVAKLVENPS